MNGSSCMLFLVCFHHFFLCVCIFSGPLILQPPPPSPLLFCVFQASKVHSQTKFKLYFLISKTYYKNLTGALVLCVLQSGVDAMPVSIKPEPHSTCVPETAPQPPPQPPQTGTTNGSSSSHRPSQTASHVPQTGHTGMSRTPNSSQPSSLPASSSSAMQGTNTATSAENTSMVSEDAIDYHSVRGVFGWATLDDINIPYIIRKYRKFVAVRIVEKKVLNKYPNSFPDELGRKEPLVSYFITEAEATLLNEINTIHCGFEYGNQPFTTKDLIVDLVEFEDFYRLVKKTFPEEVLATITAEENNRSSKDNKNIQLSKTCGWMQINNTVTPYIVRSSGKFVPLSVIQYAAQLLTKDQVEGHLPSAEECNLLNDTCKAAGFEFMFGRNTKLIHIAEVVQRCMVRISELPFENPLQHAQYIESLNQAEMVGAPPPPPPPPLGIAGSMAMPYQSKPILSEGAPNVNPFNPYNPFMSMVSMMTQTPLSAPNHSFSHARSSSAGTRPQLVCSQNAPIFFPPAPPACASQGPHMNAGALMSQASNRGLQNMSSKPPSAGVVPGPRPTSQVRSPVSHSSQLSPHLVARGVPGVMDSNQLQGGSRLPPPPVYPGLPSSRQPLHHPVSSPQHGGVPATPFLASPHVAGQQGEMMVPGIGPVPRGSLSLRGFPQLSDMVPGGPASRMSLSHAQPQSQPHLQSQSQTHLSHQQQLQYQLQAQTQVSTAGASQIPASLMKASSTVDAASKGPVFPVQLSPALQNRDPVAANLVGNMSGQMQRGSSATEDHIKLVGDIRAEMVHGKSISCMMRNSPERTGSFCLVEAVAKLYFPKCSLSEFVNALQNVLHISLPVCTEQEAKAFIHFYNLPVNKLNDNHMINLTDLNNYFPQISYMFRHSTSGPTAGKSQQPSTTRRSSGLEGPTKMVSPSAPITIMLNNNDTSEVINVDSGPSTPCSASPSVADRAGTKRKGLESGEGSGKALRTAEGKSLSHPGDEVDGSMSKKGSTGMQLKCDGLFVTVVLSVSCGCVWWWWCL